MNKKAFIFDLDGVIIDSENWWDRLYFKKAGYSLGQTIGSAFLEAKQKQPSLSWPDYLAKLNQVAKIIYSQAPITPNINQLLTLLIRKNYHLGLVSGSTQDWIKLSLKRLQYPIKLIVSLEDRKDLQPKPAPDGYLEVIKKLQVLPKNTYILEDTDMGIKSAKACGAFAICLTEHHPKNYSPQGADLYVKNIQELLTYLNSIKL